MFTSIFQAIKVVRVSGPVVAGTSDVTGTAVDMAGFDSVAFMAALGTITSGAVTSLKAQQGTDSTPTDAADLAGSGVTIADTSSDKDVWLVIHQPTERYVRPILDRGTANCVVNGIYAFLYNAKDLPVTQPAGMLGGTFLLKPAEGTA